MNILKQNETFILEETTDLYETNGSLTKDASGTFSMHFHVKKVDGDSLGDSNYHRYGENANVNFSVNCDEEVREELTAYADTVVDAVLAYFN